MQSYLFSEAFLSPAETLDQILAPLAFIPTLCFVASGEQILCFLNSLPALRLQNQCANRFSTSQSTRFSLSFCVTSKRPPLQLGRYQSSISLSFQLGWATPVVEFFLAFLLVGTENIGKPFWPQNSCPTCSRSLKGIQPQAVEPSLNIPCTHCMG